MVTKIHRAFLALPLLSIVIGCTSSSKPDVPVPAAPAGSVQIEHPHRAGAHNGLIVELGGDSYHVEVLFEKGGRLRLFTLDADETKIKEVDAKSFTAFAKADGAGEAESFELKPEPQGGDQPGLTTQFIGQLPADIVGKRVTITVPNFRIGNERFQFSFNNGPKEPHADVAMPAKVMDDAESKLYLTPGGKYTEADIKANGNVTASQKFKGVMAKHDTEPRPGDKICPITDTKANPKFTWIVGGKTYEFCCPPCVDEFVTTAKEKPEQIKEPDAYRAK